MPLEAYVQFSFLSYFLAFIGILFLQTFTIFIIDGFYLKNMTSTITLWKRILHAIQKSHLPYPYKNWHDGKGSCLQHTERKKLVQKEVLTTTIVNLAFNMVMLIPLAILCKIKNVLTHSNACDFTNIFSDHGILVRHNQLEAYLGVLDMEKESLNKAQLFLTFFPTWIVMSIIQTVCFFLANGKFHPLTVILK